MKNTSLKNATKDLVQSQGSCMQQLQILQNRTERQISIYRYPEL